MIINQTVFACENRKYCYVRHPSFIFNSSISHIFEHENFSLGFLGSSGLEKNKFEYFLATFKQYNSKKATTHDLNPECKRKSSFIDPLYIELGTTPSGINHTTRPCFFMVSLTFLVCKFTKQKFSYFCPLESRRPVTK